MFCSKCGTKLSNEANFCSNCGTPTKHSNSTQNLEIVDREVYEFSSSILRGGDILTPDRLIIGPNEVIYRKRNKYLIGVDELTIPFHRIAGVKLDRRLISSTIVITTTGSEVIRLENFAVSDGKKIQRLIQERIH